jgi:1,4-alpha-glucan branching enzyme
MNDEQRWLDRTIEELRAPVPVSPDFGRRVLEAAAIPSLGPSRWTTALTGLAAAALLVLAIRWHGGGKAGGVEFTIELPAASAVTVVGDFNDWDRGRTPLVRIDGTSTWRARLSLADGLYRYAFLVDGDRWVADPSQPGSPDPDFGATVSVVSVE